MAGHLKEWPPLPSPSPAPPSPADVAYMPSLRPWPWAEGRLEGHEGQQGGLCAAVHPGVPWTTGDMAWRGHRWSADGAWITVWVQTQGAPFFVLLPSKSGYSILLPQEDGSFLLFMPQKATVTGK